MRALAATLNLSPRLLAPPARHADAVHGESGAALDELQRALDENRRLAASLRRAREPSVAAIVVSSGVPLKVRHREDAAADVLPGLRADVTELASAWDETQRAARVKATQLEAVAAELRALEANALEASASQLEQELGASTISSLRERVERILDDHEESERESAGLTQRALSARHECAHAESSANRLRLQTIELNAEFARLVQRKDVADAAVERSHALLEAARRALLTQRRSHEEVRAMGHAREMRKDVLKKKTASVFASAGFIRRRREEKAKEMGDGLDSAHAFAAAALRRSLQAARQRLEDQKVQQLQEERWERLVNVTGSSSAAGMLKFWKDSKEAHAILVEAESGRRSRRRGLFATLRSLEADLAHYAAREASTGIWRSRHADSASHGDDRSAQLEFKCARAEKRVKAAEEHTVRSLRTIATAKGALQQMLRRMQALGLLDRVRSNIRTQLLRGQLRLGSLGAHAQLLEQKAHESRHLAASATRVKHQRGPEAASARASRASTSNRTSCTNSCVNSAPSPRRCSVSSSASRRGSVTRAARVIPSPWSAVRKATETTSTLAAMGEQGQGGPSGEIHPSSLSSEAKLQLEEEGWRFAVSSRAISRSANRAASRPLSPMAPQTPPSALSKTGKSASTSVKFGAAVVVDDASTPVASGDGRRSSASRGASRIASRRASLDGNCVSYGNAEVVADASTPVVSDEGRRSSASRSASRRTSFDGDRVSFGNAVVVDDASTSVASGEGRRSSAERGSCRGASRRASRRPSLDGGRTSFGDTEVVQAPSASPAGVRRSGDISGCASDDATPISSSGASGAVDARLPEEGELRSTDAQEPPNGSRAYVQRPSEGRRASIAPVIRRPEDRRVSIAPETVQSRRASIDQGRRGRRGSISSHGGRGYIASHGRSNSDPLDTSPKPSSTRKGVVQLTNEEKAVADSQARWIGQLCSLLDTFLENFMSVAGLPVSSGAPDVTSSTFETILSQALAEASANGKDVTLDPTFTSHTFVKTTEQIEAELHVEFLRQANAEEAAESFKAQKYDALSDLPGAWARLLVRRQKSSKAITRAEMKRRSEGDKSALHTRFASQLKVMSARPR